MIIANIKIEYNVGIESKAFFSDAQSLTIITY